MAIINCPECNNKVSDMASVCPHCGVKIDGNIIECPDCGKILLKRENRCPNCGCLFNGKEILITSVENDTREFPEYRHREFHYGRIMGYVLLFAGLIALIAGFFFIISFYRESESMEKSYASLEKCQDQEVLKDFMEKYPRSHTEEIKQRLNTLQEIENGWKSIADSSNVNLFNAFMAKYPDNMFASICKNKIDSLDWVDASNVNTIESYRHYLELHLDGKYKKMAEEAKTDIEKATATSTERSAIKNVLGDYFEAISSNNAERIHQLTSEKTYGQTMEFTTKLHSMYQHVSFTIENTPSILRASITDSTFNYVSKFRVMRVLTSSTGEMFTQDYYASFYLNRDKQIISIYLGKIRSREENDNETD